MLLQIDPKKLKPNSWNPNKVDPINQEKLAKSMEIDGLAKPILVRKQGKNYEIIDGEHRVGAAISLKWKEINCLDLGDISDAKAKKLTLTANSRYGEDDQNALYKLLTSDDFASAEEILATLPIDETELADLFTHEDLNFDDLDDDLDDLDDEGLDLGMDSGKSKQTHKIVRFKFSIEDAERVADLVERTKQDQGMTEGDQLENAGDALLHLLGQAL